MGSVSLAISKAAKEAGTHVVTDAEVCSMGILFLRLHNITASVDEIAILCFIFFAFWCLSSIQELFRFIVDVKHVYFA